MMIDRRGFVVGLFAGSLDEHNFCAHGHITLAQRDVTILSGRVSGRTPSDVADGIFDLAERTAIAVPPDSAAHRALTSLLGQRVEGDYASGWRMKVIEETREVCTLCGGRGQEYDNSSTSGQRMCRACGGCGQVLTKTVTRHEEIDMSEIKVSDLAEFIRQRQLLRQNLTTAIVRIL